jgi:hypothetical protein
MSAVREGLIRIRGSGLHTQSTTLELPGEAHFFAFNCDVGRNISLGSLIVKEL